MRVKTNDVEILVIGAGIAGSAAAYALAKKGIDYSVVDVTEDQAAYEHVVSLGYQQVPVVETGEDHWSGYRPDMISQLAVRVSA